MSRADAITRFSIRLFSLLWFLWAGPAPAQNIVGADPEGRTVDPVTLSDRDVDILIRRTPRLQSPSMPPTNDSPEILRITRKLDDHVKRFLDGAPWMPLQQTLGISGYETAFAHPDEVVYALAVATSLLPEATARRVRVWLAKTIHDYPPMSPDGWEFQVGRPRESHDVPPQLRRAGRGRASSLFGIYALWACTFYAGDTNAAGLSRSHWPAVKQRSQELLKGDYAFDPKARSDGRGEAERLNGNLAGLIGLIRLAKANLDAETEISARQRCRQLLESRVNLDRLNPAVLEPSRAATRSLHNAKLARSLQMAPEVADFLADRTDGCAANNSRAFREARNGWFLAYGDRMVGGENYTNPIHVPWAMFANAALIEKIPAPELASYIDVPWCHGDIYFVLKCVLTIWVARGRAWIEL